MVTNGALGENLVTWYGMGSLGIPGESPGHPNTFILPPKREISAKLDDVTRVPLETRSVERAPHTSPDADAMIKEKVLVLYQAEPQRWHYAGFNPALVATLLQSTDGVVELVRIPSMGGYALVARNQAGGFGILMSLRS